ncbi:ATPase_AAA_core domain-containing protein [Azospirillaceae bacterium]
MLVEFSVGNFLSIKDRQTISMVPGASRDVRDKFSFLTGLKHPSHLLRAIAVFGPNAAGKTSLLMGLVRMANFVLDSAKEQEGDEIDVVPFKLSRETREQPSEFEITFIQDHDEKKTRFQYGFSATREKVIEEWLFATPEGGRSQRWFQRAWNAEDGEYQWYINSTHVKGERETWKKATRDNASFLSTAVQLKADSLRAPYSWFRNGFRAISNNPMRSVKVSVFSANKCEKEKTKIVDFMKSIDLSIHDIKIVEEERKFHGSVPEEVRNNIIKSFGDKEKKVFFGHVDNEGEVQYFHEGEESSGTIAAINFSGPLLDVLDKGRTLVVDEIQNSLHPLALRRFIEMFIDDKSNPHGAQLIFITHDTFILKNYLHRDQVWLIERNERQETIVRPLSDYKPRENEALDKGYLEGRYGALPFITAGDI